MPADAPIKTFLFVNPLSGHFTAYRFQTIFTQLAKNGINPEIFWVRTPAEIISCYNSGVVNEGSPLIIIAGGDGTINAVVNSLKPGASTLAILPLGTSNVLAKEIGISSIEIGLQKIATGVSRPLSVGFIELEGRTHRFLLMAGIGVDGAVVRDVWPLGKRFMRQGAYALSALKCALQWDTARFEISSPDRVVACHTAIICNVSRYGGNFILSPDCSPFIPGLTAVCITGNNRRTYLDSALELFSNRAAASRNLTRIHSSNFEIRGAHPIQIDGDFIGYGPARISECVDFVKIIV